MKSGAIVEDFDPFGNRRAGLLLGGEHGAVDKLVLQSAEERFGERVVPALPDSTHRSTKVQRRQMSGETATGVLAAAVAVKDRAWLEIPACARHRHRLADQLGTHVGGH